MTVSAVIRLNRNGPAGVGLEFWGHCESEDVVAGAPTESGYNYFTDASGQLTSGVWECTAYTARFESYPVDEFCHILSGQVEIVGDDGTTETFVAGDAFVIPRGTRCTWKMPGTVRKFYVIFDRAAPASDG